MNLLESLPSPVRLPIRGLIAITILLVMGAIAGGTLYALYVLAGFIPATIWFWAIGISVAYFFAHWIGEMVERAD